MAKKKKHEHSADCLHAKIKMLDLQSRVLEDGKFQMVVKYDTSSITVEVDLHNMQALSELGIIGGRLEELAEKALEENIKRDPKVLETLLRVIAEHTKEVVEDEIVRRAMENVNTADLETVLKSFEKAFGGDEAKEE